MKRGGPKNISLGVERPYGMFETKCAPWRITEEWDQSKRDGGKRDIAGEARRSAHVCGASGEERSFVLPCSSDCGDH